MGVVVALNIKNDVQHQIVAHATLLGNPIEKYRVNKNQRNRHCRNRSSNQRLKDGLQIFRCQFHI